MTIFGKIAIILLCLVFITNIILFRIELKEDYETNYTFNKLNITIDSLQYELNQLKTDTLLVNEWKFYGDTIQYIGKEDSVLISITPTKWYRLIIESNENNKASISLNYECYNDTISKESI